MSGLHCVETHATSRFALQIFFFHTGGYQLCRTTAAGSDRLRRVPKKGGQLCLNPSISANIRPTQTYDTPNQWIFNEDFAEVYRFEIATLIEADNLVKLSPLFYHSSWYNWMRLKSGLGKIQFSHSHTAAISNLPSSSESS